MAEKTIWQKIKNYFLLMRQKELYQCPECKLWYKEKEWAEKCEVWCRKHRSCNLEIIKHAIKGQK